MKKIILLLSLLLIVLAACSDEEKPSATTTFTPAPPTPTAAYSYYLGIGGYPFLTTEQVGDIAAQSRVRLVSSRSDGTATLYTVIAEDEQTSAEATEAQLKFAPDVTPNAPIPTAAYQSYIGMGLLFITNEAIGDIPANTRVRISVGQPAYNGWSYVITTEDETITATARESQLSLAPDVNPGGTPTPNATLTYYAGIGGYPYVTTEQVGDIAANTRVNITGTTFDGLSTIYVIADAKGVSAQAKEDQITFAPDVTPGAPLPTDPFAGYIGMGDLFVTTEQVGDIVAGTRVGISHAQVNYDGWVYFIVATDGQTIAEARANQITFAPDVTPGPTPTHVP